MDNVELILKIANEMAIEALIISLNINKDEALREWANATQKQKDETLELTIPLACIAIKNMAEAAKDAYEAGYDKGWHTCSNGAEEYNPNPLIDNHLLMEGLILNEVNSASRPAQ